MKKKPGVRDVAALSGLSIGTVSKYLNSPNSVKPENKNKIYRAIKELDYTPNYLAQRLGRGHSFNLLLYIVSEDMIYESTWLHLLPLIQVFGDYIRDTKYNMQMKIAKAIDFDVTYENIVEYIDGSYIDGIAIVSPWQVHDKIIHMLIDRKFPFVLIDNYVPGIETNKVTFDNKDLVENIVEYLYKRGHRKIGFISVDSEQQHISERYRGYVSGLQKNNLKLNNNWTCYGDFSVESGYLAASDMIRKNDMPTAVIGGNDNMAVGFLNALVEKGISVPDEVSLVGIDDSIVAQSSLPRLTSVQLPMKEMGLAAVQSLIKSIEDDQTTVEFCNFNYELIERDSVITIVD